MSACGLLFALLVLNLSAQVRTVVVHTDSGALSGTNITTLRGRAVSAFLGVPYAKPPIGEYRFQEPQPVEKWEGIRPAHNFSSICIQYTYFKVHPEPVQGDEDCLYLNIFTPVVSGNTKLNVVFYIHGGAFMYGSGSSYNGDYLLENHDMVYVSVNYRVGPFGFLTTEDGIIPGNNGLKDQLLALQWIRNNIEYFGGDRNKITIAGTSAGGASVHLHYFSPLSRNLFSQGISLSGSAFCPWVLAENSHSKAQMLASSVGCPTSDSKLLLECLQLKSAKTILSQIEQLFMPWNYNPFSPFGVVVESNSSTAFLSKNPYELLKAGDIKDAPWLTSVTTEEGLYPAAEFITNDTLLEELDENWTRIAPHLLDFNHTIPQNQLSDMSEKIKKFYLGDQKINKQSVKELVQMISDRIFTVDVERAARLQASVTTSPVFFYSFAYRGKYSSSDSLCKCNENLGASHGDDLEYVLNTKYGFSALETESDKDMLNTVVNIWTSFIESGVPSASPDIVWTPVSSNASDGGNLTYLLISSSNDIKQLSTKGLSNLTFWDALPFKELWNAVDNNETYVVELK